MLSNPPERSIPLTGLPALCMPLLIHFPARYVQLYKSLYRLHLLRQLCQWLHDSASIYPVASTVIDFVYQSYMIPATSFVSCGRTFYAIQTNTCELGKPTYQSAVVTLA